MGFCGFRPFFEPPELQLLYGFLPAYWSQGFATEAARAMIEFGFQELGFDRIVASVDAPNIPSLRVLERAGMSFDRRETINGLDTSFYILDREKE
jgi:ribosomal-protein-alanine N-acetyltransferase